MNPFRRPALLVLLGGTALSVLSWILLIVFGDRIAEAGTHEPSSYSWSALGHRALVALLRDQGVPVVVSRHDSAARAGEEGLLLLAEPKDEGALRDSRDARRVLLVLPKWEGARSEENPDWIGEAKLLPADAPERTLNEAGLFGSVLRTGEVADWASGRYPVEPTLPDAQLLQGFGLDVLLGSEKGALFGVVRRGRRSIHVLSDPDLLSNRGLGKGRNAELAVRMIDDARQGGTVFVDETCHGFEAKPSLASELFRPPLAFALAQALAAAALLVWSGARRFGAPAPRPPPLPPGKSFLIGNTAALLRFGGHAHHALDRYYRNAVQEAARHRNPPPGLDAKETERWLLGTAGEGGLGRLTRAMAAELERVRQSGRRRPLFLLRAARRIHRWKEEMVHGPRENP